MNSTAPRNTTDTRRRALPLILLFPVAIALSACRSTFAFNASDPNNATLVIEFDTEIRGSTAKCSSLQPILDRQRNYIGEGTVEEVSGSVGVGCRVTYSKFTALGRVMFMRQRGDEITVEIPKPFWDAIVTQLKQANVPESRFASFNFNVTFELPSDVLSASAGGQINGKKVSWSGFTTVLNGIRAVSKNPYSTAYPSTSPHRTPSRTPSRAPSSVSADSSKEEDGESGGFPVWGWVAIGVGAGAALVVVIALIARRRKNGNGGHPGSHGGFPGGLPPAGSPFGQSYGPQQAPPGGHYGQPGYPPGPGQEAPNPFGSPYGQTGPGDTSAYGHGQQPGQWDRASPDGDRSRRAFENARIDRAGQPAEEPPSARRRREFGPAGSRSGRWAGGKNALCLSSSVQETAAHDRLLSVRTDPYEGDRAPGELFEGEHVVACGSRQVAEGPAG